MVTNSHTNDLRMRYKKIPVVINIRRISSPENIDFGAELNILKPINRQLCYRAFRASLKRNVEITKS